MKILERLFTKNLHSIPLLFIHFNYNKYKSEGAKGSCMAKIHPNLRDDKYIEETLDKLIDYIRNNHDMDKI